MRNAGRELDALVAEKVMECQVIWREQNLPFAAPKEPHCGCPERIHETPFRGLSAYSTSIAAAWQVWEHLAQREGWFANVQTCCRPEHQWCAIVADGEGHLWEGQADTAPLAICLAALKAVGIEVPE